MNELPSRVIAAWLECFPEKLLSLECFEWSNGLGLSYIKHTFYHFRNNLTILETVVIQGQGGCGELRFGNRKAYSASPLLFDMSEKHLKYCHSKCR